VPYKQVFARVYPDEVLGDRPLDDALAFLPDGRLSVQFAETPEVVDVGVHEPVISSLVLSGDEPSQAADTPDQRYHVEIESFDHQGVTEYWLIHTDQANGKFKRAKLNSEYRASASTGPRVIVSPGGAFFLTDDSGTVRLYTSKHLIEAGVFQVAHPKTENRIIALAISNDDRLVAVLSSWKDIVLYNVPDRRVAFVRQIRDEVGWYDAPPSHILVAGNAEAIVTVGASKGVNDQGRRLSVNAFRFIALNVPA
jgi:hypothetical protein